MIINRNFQVLFYNYYVYQQNDFGKLLEDMKIPEKFSNVEKIHSEDLHENESWSINSNNYMDVTDDVAEQYTSDMELLYNQLVRHLKTLHLQVFSVDDRD
jgi:hypothetical protein